VGPWRRVDRRHRRHRRRDDTARPGHAGGAIPGQAHDRDRWLRRNRARLDHEIDGGGRWELPAYAASALRVREMLSSIHEPLSRVRRGVRLGRPRRPPPRRRDRLRSQL
jgi:hypothetical protein